MRHIAHYDHHGHHYDAAEYDLDHDHQDPKRVEHQIRVRRELEKCLERRRLKEELEDYDGELDRFDWSAFDDRT